MFEININGTVYAFKFGMGFMREINKKIGVPVEGLADVKKFIGLQYIVAGIVDYDIEALVEALEVANKGNSPRITKAILDDYIDNPETDIDELFEKVLDFLKKGNATKKAVAKMLEAVEAEKAKTAV